MDRRLIHQSPPQLEWLSHLLSVSLSNSQHYPECFLLPSHQPPKGAFAARKNIEKAPKDRAQTSPASAFCKAWVAPCNASPNGGGSGAVIVLVVPSRNFGATLYGILAVDLLKGRGSECWHPFQRGLRSRVVKRCWSSSFCLCQSRSIHWHLPGCWKLGHPSSNQSAVKATPAATLPPFPSRTGVCVCVYIYICELYMYI